MDFSKFYEIKTSHETLFSTAFSSFSRQMNFSMWKKLIIPIWKYVSNELLTAMDFYKKKGFLKTFSGVYHLFYVPKNITNVTQVTDRSWFYKILGHNTLWMYNYCYLKYGTKYSHVQIGDSDEMPLFNFTKYGNIMNAIRDTEMVYKERRGEDLERDHVF